MPNIEKLSASSYKLFSHCEMAYFIQYILKWQFRPGKAADLGTICHAVLEIFAQIKLGQQNGLSEVETEIGVIKTDKPDLEPIVEKVWKFYTTKDEYQNQEWELKDLKAIKKWVLICLNHNNKQFNPLLRDIVSTEKYINFHIKEPWAILPDGSNLRVTGFVDLITRVNKNTLEITDYKTGSLKDFHTGVDIDIHYAMKDIQLRLYHMALAEELGCDNNYILTLFYLKHAKPITICFDCSELKTTKEMIKRQFVRILNSKIPKLNRSWKCKKFCEYGKNTFESTKIPSMIQFLDGQITYPNNNMCICDQVHFEINRRGVNWVEENMKYIKPEEPKNDDGDSGRICEEVVK